MDRNQNDNYNQNIESVSSEKTNTNLHETAGRVEDPNGQGIDSEYDNKDYEKQPIVNKDEDEDEDQNDFAEEIENEEEDDDIKDDEDDDIEE